MFPADSCSRPFLVALAFVVVCSASCPVRASVLWRGMNAGAAAATGLAAERGAEGEGEAEVSGRLRSERGGARARAADASRGYAGEVPLECHVCKRWLDRGRMSVVAVGEAETCGLCTAIGMIQGAVVESHITRWDEEVAMERLAAVYRMLRRA